MQKIIETLSQLGYCVEWRVYNSADYLPKSEKEFTLQDVLESTVPEKYWLSEKATARIAGKLNKS